MKQASKKMQIMVLAIIILGTVAACDWGKSTTIVTKSANVTQKIKYSGKVIFNQAQDGIEKISKGGYLEFELNGRKFKAEEGKEGKVNYEFDGDSKVSTLSNDQKSFVAEAVKIIIKERSKLHHDKN
jgi:hypothetical protein